MPYTFLTLRRAGWLAACAPRSRRSTVKTHVNRVLSKLGLDSRLQATVYAYRHGIAGPPNLPAEGG